MSRFTQIKRTFGVSQNNDISVFLEICKNLFKLFKRFKLVLNCTGVENNFSRTIPGREGVNKRMLEYVFRWFFQSRYIQRPRELAILLFLNVVENSLADRSWLVLAFHFFFDFQEFLILNVDRFHLVYQVEHFIDRLVRKTIDDINTFDAGLQKGLVITNSCHNCMTPHIVTDQKDVFHIPIRYVIEKIVRHVSKSVRLHVFG